MERGVRNKGNGDERKGTTSNSTRRIEGGMERKRRVCPLARC
jgi:hypothetical protein